ncbi:MAG: ExsB family transcriptional regulator [Candidatus Aminicenantes bacterium RBG_13_63_10]|nr:MAG: ExsB family transcriptional regulator [Candidatus Aminicenantes bacterium RBG_13_63_10]
MNAKKFIADKVREIKVTVGAETAVSALSGGVDSSACTMLAARALGNQLKVIFIDDGLMRQDEPEEVRGVFAKLGVKVEVIDARREFFKSLKRKTDPEKKRKAFRERFYKVFGREVKRSGARFLVQGTIKADIIETQGGVKTQHNILEQIGIDPEKGFGFRVVEPLKDLFKPDVRLVARALGLPERIYNRMPFPGPGLACRVVGEVTPERVETLRRATVLVEAELVRLKPFQAFAVLLSDRGTGVHAGRRRFGDIIIVRSVDSSDAMTARPTQVPWPALNRLAKKITDEIPSVTRVCYELTPKPPATIEYI